MPNEYSNRGRTAACCPLSPFLLLFLSFCMGACKWSCPCLQICDAGAVQNAYLCRCLLVCFLNPRSRKETHTYFEIWFLCRSLLLTVLNLSFVFLLFLHVFLVWCSPMGARHIFIYLHFFLLVFVCCCLFFYCSYPGVFWGVLRAASYTVVVGVLQ